MTALKEAAEAEREATESVMSVLQEELARTSTSNDQVNRELADMTALKEAAEAEKDNMKLLMLTLQEELANMTAKEKKTAELLKLREKSVETLSKQDADLKHELSVAKDSLSKLKQNRRLLQLTKFTL